MSFEAKDWTIEVDGDKRPVESMRFAIGGMRGDGAEIEVVSALGPQGQARHVVRLIDTRLAIDIDRERRARKNGEGS